MAAAEGHSDRIEMQDKGGNPTQPTPGAAAGTPKKLSATNVVELIRIIRALESTMCRHIEALGSASPAATSAAAAAAAGPTEQTGSGTDDSVGDGMEASRAPAVRRTLSKPRRSSSRLNGVVADGLTSTKVVRRSDKVCVVRQQLF
jgi:hypothetical protein